MLSTLSWPLWLLNNPFIPLLLTPYHIPYSSCSKLPALSSSPQPHPSPSFSGDDFTSFIMYRSFFGFHLTHLHIAISNASDLQEDVLLHLAKFKLSAGVLDPSPNFNDINNNNSKNQM